MEEGRTHFAENALKLWSKDVWSPVNGSSQVMRAHPGRENLVLNTFLGKKKNQSPQIKCPPLFFFYTVWVLWVFPAPQCGPQSTGRKEPHLKESCAPSFQCSLCVLKILNIQPPLKAKPFHFKAFYAFHAHCIKSCEVTVKFRFLKSQSTVWRTAEKLLGSSAFCANYSAGRLAMFIQILFPASVLS